MSEDYTEEIRQLRLLAKEADSTGYARAMREVRDWVAKKASIAIWASDIEGFIEDKLAELGEGK